MRTCAEIRPMGDADLERALAVNEASVEATGHLEKQTLRRLLEISFLSLVAGEGEAFLVVLDQDADYASPNHRWFRSRYDRFVYVDRIVVSAAARGQGLGRKLYERMFEAAADAGHTVVGCEVNIDPPNPVSHDFHAALGFREAGRAQLPNRKTVQYYTRPLP